MKTFKEVEEHIVAVLKHELPDTLYYHGIHHTMDVLSAVQEIAPHEQVTENDLLLLKVAALYHDAGFIRVYKNHEEESCRMAVNDLPGYGFTADEISSICGMIMATKIPQNPKNKLEEILADADLEYLGTDDFERIAHTLFEEMKVHTSLKTEEEWNRIQLSFLKAHRYHTDYCRKTRESKKQAHIAAIERLTK